MKDLITIYNHSDLSKFSICCGFYKHNDEIYYFDDFDKVDKENYNNIFYFIAESDIRPRWCYTLNEDLFGEYQELIDNSKLYKKEEFHEIGIKCL
jgi:hypothetical protein